MLHCWQPKHKYALNCCQAGRSRKKKKKAPCRDLQPWKRGGCRSQLGRTGSCWPCPRLCSWGARGETLSRLPTAPGGSWKGKPLGGFPMWVQKSEGPKAGEKPRDVCGAVADAPLCAGSFAAGFWGRSGGVLSCGGLRGAALCGSFISLPRHIPMQITGIDSAALAAAAAGPCLSPGVTARAQLAARGWGRCWCG